MRRITPIAVFMLVMLGSCLVLLQPPRPRIHVMRDVADTPGISGKTGYSPYFVHENFFPKISVAAMKE